MITGRNSDYVCDILLYYGAFIIKKFIRLDLPVLIKILLYRIFYRILLDKIPVMFKDTICSQINII